MVTIDVGNGNMERQGTPVRNGEDQGFVCPVCDGQGTQQGLWNHLRYDHGWEAERIRAEIEISADGEGGSGQS